MSHASDRVLVTYASTGGTTRTVAEFVAARLHARGLRADVHSLAEVPDPSGYGAVVVGSAVHNAALLPDAEAFLSGHADALRRVPVWLFSLGVGPSLRGPFGRVLRTRVPPRIARLCELIGPREYRAFAGVVPRNAVDPVNRVLLRLCGGRYGDLRDWSAIDAWTVEIAKYLHGGVPA